MPAPAMSGDKKSGSPRPLRTSAIALISRLHHRNCPLLRPIPGPPNKAIAQLREPSRTAWHNTRRPHKANLPQARVSTRLQPQVTQYSHCRDSHLERATVIILPHTYAAPRRLRPSQIQLWRRYVAIPNPLAAEKRAVSCTPREPADPLRDLTSDNYRSTPPTVKQNFTAFFLPQAVAGRHPGLSPATGYG